MAIKTYDVFVIGTGSAGKTVAYQCKKAGMTVAIADHQEFGGTCANRGCDPKKVLVGITEAMQLSENLIGKGISNAPTIHWNELQKFKQTFTGAVPATTERDLTNAGIDMYHQSPMFLDESTLSVEGKTVHAKKIVIASGMHPVELKIPGREHMLLSKDFLDLSTLPEEIIFVGAGYVGMEMAHIAARCGAKVTLIEFGDRILAPFEADMVAYLQEVSEQIGIDFIFNAEVVEVEKLRTNYRVFYQKSGKKQSVKAKAVFKSAGRVPSIAMLDLEQGNVAYEKEGISVNRYLQNTTNSNVYACGDVSASGSLPLTPFSSKESKIVAQNIIEGNKTKLTIPPTPSVVFTLPQLASIGLTEEEAKKKYDIEVVQKDASQWYNARRLNEPAYAYKFILDQKTDRMLGAHLVGNKAGEMINMLAMMMVNKMTRKEMKQMILAYPTWGIDILGML